MRICHQPLSVSSGSHGRFAQLTELSVSMNGTIACL